MLLGAKYTYVVPSTLTKHITPPSSGATKNVTLEKRRQVFIEDKKAKMKQGQSMVEMKNETNRKLSEIVSGQNSDSEVPYTSLLTNECKMENVLITEGICNILILCLVSLVITNIPSFFFFSIIFKNSFLVLTFVITRKSCTKFYPLTL